MNSHEQTPAAPLLEARELSLSYPGRPRKVVDRVSFKLFPGSTLGLVGGSGAGKSSVARLVMRLARADSGTTLFNGVDMLNMNPKQSMHCRQKMQLVFQDPSASLSPRRTVQQTLLEPLNHFNIGNRKDRLARISQTLLTVGLSPDALMHYPHQFSTGQQQRIAIARALVTDPELLVADEAVSSLDVSVQAQILQLVRTLQKENGIAFLFISHDLGVIRQIADQVAVMYRGRLVEQTPSEVFFREPAHPYSRSLLAFARNERQALHDQWQLESGMEMVEDSAVCDFSRGCPKRLPICEHLEPGTHRVGQEKPQVAAHYVKCHLYDEPTSNES